MHSDYENNKAEQTTACDSGGAASLGNAVGMAQSGIIGKALNEPCRAPLVEQVASQLIRAETEAREARRLRELAKLLEKNPDVARILDLMGIEAHFRW